MKISIGDDRTKQTDELWDRFQKKSQKTANKSHESGENIVFYPVLDRDRGIDIQYFLSALESLSCFCISALAYAPIVLYNGRRGAREWKYVYYAFYPVHLALLYFIAGWAARKVGI